MEKSSDVPGVTAEELYLRQNGLCRLVSIYDKTDGVTSYAGLYCTYKTDYEKTVGLLNPTNECIRCIVSYFEDILGDYMKELGINKRIILLMQKLFPIQEKTVVYMSEETFNWLDEYISNNTLYSDLTRPIRVASDGNIYIFGATYEKDDSLSFGIVKVGDEEVDISH